MFTKRVCLLVCLMVGLIVARPTAHNPILVEDLGTLGVAGGAAATCTVTSNLDKFDIVEGYLINLTPGGLRALLADPNCDPITFGGDYIIRLAYTLSIDRNVTIDGDGHAVIISGDTYGDGTQDWAVFNISADVAPTVALRNITVTKGHNGENGGGGGIKNVGGDLTVSNCTVSDNRESTGDGSSGGGGIWNYGNLEVINSTFSGNSTTMRGGAIYNAYGTLTVTNSTFSGNKAGYEGGAIHNSGGVVTVRNSIVAQGIPCDNENGQYQCKNCSGTIVGADNLVDDNTCGESFTYSSSINLGALDNYGGSTQTIPLLAGSSAIDTGADLSAYGVTTDQRGVSRPQGLAYDIGAYEADVAPPVVTVPENITVEATGPTVVTFTASALDGVDGPLLATCSPASGSTFQIGAKTVTCWATDSSSNTGSASFTVTVTNVPPPPSTITVTATPSTIWPPNKKMVPVKLVVTPANATAPIVSVTCNEAIADSDWKITGPLTLNLRADRNGNGSGRVYTINVSYGSGSTATVQVKVPHDQRK